MGDRTPRELINEAEGMPFGQSRRSVLTTVLELLDAEDPATKDVEARAVALAMLAQQDTRYLDEAGKALDLAVEHQVPLNWILVQLAEAWLEAGDLTKALGCASSVEREYFDDQDLHWRSVRMDEVRAAALLGLGRLREGQEVASHICAELAVRGEEDDLAPPRSLARAALALVASGSSAEERLTGCTVLRAISNSIELETWFPASFVEELRHGLLTCDGPESNATE